MDTEIRKRLLEKAGAYLSQRAHSRGELRRKLMKLAGESDVESALDRLQQLNLLNDPEYAYNFALCRLKQDGWGPAKIRDSLLRRQVPESAIQQAMERAWSEFDEESALKEYLQRRLRQKAFPNDSKGVMKLIVHLRRRGFDEENILRVLKRMVPAGVMQDLDTGD